MSQVVDLFQCVSDGMAEIELSPLPFLFLVERDNPALECKTIIDNTFDHAGFKGQGSLPRGFEKGKELCIADGCGFNCLGKAVLQFRCGKRVRSRARSQSTNWG